MTIDIGTGSICLLTGLLLGVVFYGGLWLTLKLVLRTPFAAPLIPISFLLRAFLVVVGLKLVCGAEWPRYAVAMIGFLPSRLLFSQKQGREAATHAA